MFFFYFFLFSTLCAGPARPGSSEKLALVVTEPRPINIPPQTQRKLQIILFEAQTAMSVLEITYPTNGVRREKTSDSDSVKRLEATSLSGFNNLILVAIVDCV